ncbi:multidrug resistance-associated protein 4-like [Contarinia nasturtii]|uniref:multidrug resistance-associated protein 4-like n=1 Tax=Contarinia nasturtii TaxID=265458 RepID=UPI0012D3F072|nr:multidrug resistance-associated protein 4-like [Contarinia nasturtii]
MESAQQKLPPNPRETANFFSKIFLWWTFPLFRKGYRKILHLDDIYQPLKCDRSELLGDRLETQWNKQALKPKRNALLKAIVATFWKDYILLISLSFFNEIVLRLGPTFLLGYLLEYFRKDSGIEDHMAILYAAGFVLLNGLSSLVASNVMLLSFHNGMKVRVSVCSVIYRKALKISQTALGETPVGKVVNLLSNDVNRFDWASLFINSLLTSPIVTLVIGCLMWKDIGVGGLVGMIVVFFIVPILSYAGKLTSTYRRKMAVRTDERVRFMDEIISAAQVIKMYSWERPFAKLIDYARKMELKFLRKKSYIAAFQMTFIVITTRLAIFCAMLTIVLVDGPDKINAAKIYVMSSYFRIISQVLSMGFARSFAETAEILVALRRLEKLLILEEKKIPAQIENGNSKGVENRSVEKITQVNISATEDPNTSISMKNVSARWISSSGNLEYSSKDQSATAHQNGEIKNDESAAGDIETQTLDNLNVSLPKGKLIGVIGPVGSGKSSFLQALLRELPLESGSININGSISYASQESWIFPASVRQNILFGTEYDRNRYNAVVETCSLTKDFEQLENGDLTIVGDRGASLSGGQKARINLARACYRNADTYLLDDPLSAVDAHVGTHIFNKCIGQNSRLAKMKATRILVTHQVHFLKEADWLIVLKDGKIEAQGSPLTLSRSGIDYVQLVGEIKTPEIDENFEVFKRQTSSTSSIKSQLSRQTSIAPSINSGDIPADMSGSHEKIDQGVGMESSSKGKVKGSVSLNYFKAGAPWPVLSLLFGSFVFVQLIASLVDYWVSIWTNQEETRALQKNAIFNSTLQESRSLNDMRSLMFDITSFTLSTDECIYIFGSLIAALFIFTFLRSIGFYVICVRVSHKLHNAMFNGLISTSMRFFDTNPLGRTLNRFSKDIGAVDEMLPRCLFDATQILLALTGSVVLVAVVNPLSMVPVIVLGFFLIIIQRIYLKTSKNLKRLEGMTKSPAYTHLSSTLTGLSTVRAYNAEKTLRTEFDNHQNLHSACWYLVISTSSVFGLSIDMICLMFTSCIIFYYVFFGRDVSGDQIGLAITQAMGLNGMVQWGVRQLSEVSNQMMSVERVLEYRDLEPEKQLKKLISVSKEWPSKGCIEFRNVYYRYAAEAEPVLCDLSLVIKSMEKIGIVGRTGAGKSSLIGSLFRLACVEGDILIDGVNTAEVLLRDLRRQIAIIPQDPVLFSGTLRRNLDPFEEYSDADVWNALESVELKSAVSEFLGLQSQVLPHGANYSVGQRQLLCLARAILRKNRILVMDEATANVDPQTDALIQQTIRNKFTDCTVLTIAHRLHTIIDSDRILVMDFGKIAEFDEPHILLQNENGIFHGMVKALGDQEFIRLSQVALRQNQVIHSYL